MAPQTISWNVTWLAISMDKLTLASEMIRQNALDIIRELRKGTTHQEQLLEKLIIYIQLQAEKIEQMEHKDIKAESSVLTPAWMPSPHGVGSDLELIQSSSKIRMVGSIQTPPCDPLIKLRSTWLVDRLYTRHLKQYAVVRRLAAWTWGNGHYIYVNFFSNKKENRWRKLAKLSDFVKKRKIPTLGLVDSENVETPEPKVFPVSEQSYLASVRERYTFPEIYVATIKNAMTCGGTNLILADGEVVCNDLFDLKRDYTSEELHGRTQINTRTSRIRWLLHDEAPEPIPVAATFVDACALNYAHWMSEVLPRVALFCAEERFKQVPIVVNEGMHQNIMESLLLVAGTEREIITLPIGRALSVDELYLTSVAGYVPFDRRTNKLSGHSHGMFSLRAFEVLRNRLNARAQNAEEEAWPEKIFLRRNSGTRKVTNSVELEKLLIARGYVVVVEPEKLTFTRQIQLFNNAKEIVSSTGAALANAIFCKPGTQIAVLMSKHENMIYRYWSNMLTPIQIKVSYVLGNIVENRDLGIHGNFAVDADNLSDLLEDFSKK